MAQLGIVVVSSIPPIIERLVETLRGLGHHPLAVLAARRPRTDPPPPPEFVQLGDATVPEGLDLLFARDKHAIEPLLRAYEPELMLCWGFPWKIPPAALEVPKLAAVNLHPAYLPQHRGPIPFAWGFREGATHFGCTWHYMDAELDTGNILEQGRVPIEDDDTHILQIGPRLTGVALELLPRVLERVQAGDPGTPQDDGAATWAGHFEDDDYAEIDWTKPARDVHNQVRAWRFTFNLSGVVGARTELDGERLRLVATSLTEKPGARRVECGDGPIWIVESEAL